MEVKHEVAGMLMQRVRCVVVGCCWMGVAGTVLGETQVVEQAEMVVSAEPLHSGRVIGRDASIAATLARMPGVRVTSQGIPGGQADLSIRGSSFSGAGIALNGLALPNAQTEHFNAELPVIAGVLSEPEVLAGMDQVRATDGHLVGTANFSIMPVNTRRSLTLGLAEDEGYWMSTLLQERRSVMPGGGYTGVGAFGAYTEVNAVDYDDNDVRSARGGGQFQLVHGDSQWDVLVAHQEKQFGARGYYGVTPAWDADEATEDTLVFGSWQRGDTSERYLRSSVMRREQTDDYTLYGSLPGVYRNAHRTVTHSGMVDGRCGIAPGVELDWRIHGREERIRSNALGDHERAQGGMLLLPGLQWKRWAFAAGVQHEIFEDDESETLPQAAIDLALTECLALRLSHSQRVRQPSYTELNYESPASLGNAGLENQTAETTELLVRAVTRYGVDWKLGVFQRTTRDAVDWIRETSESQRWTAENLGTIDTEGLVLDVTYQATGGSRVMAGYQYLHKTHAISIYSSRYALDYPEHFLLVSGLWKLHPRVGIEFTQALRRQDNNPLRQSSDSGYNGTLSLHVAAWRDPRAQFSVMVHNLWDDDYEYFPGQATVASRRISAGLTLDW